MLKGFTTDSYSDTADAIAALSTGGSPRAAAIIEALRAEQLYFIGDPPALYIKTADGKYQDAATGAAVTPPSDPDPVRLNNRLRSVVESAVGDLTLLSPNMAKRREAADTVFHTRNPAVLPTLDQAIAKETDATTKAALMRARAAVIAVSPDAPEADRIKAIETVRSAYDQEGVAILSEVAANSSGRVKTAADAALGIGEFTHRLVVLCAECLVRHFAWVLCCCLPRSASRSPSA